MSVIFFPFKPFNFSLLQEKKKKEKKRAKADAGGEHGVRGSDDDDDDDGGAGGEHDGDESVPKAKKARKAKDTAAPMKARTGYLFFTAHVRQAVAAHMQAQVGADVKLNNKQLMARLGHLWTVLDDDRKAYFEALHEDDKKRYEDDLKKYEAGDYVGGANENADDADNHGDVEIVHDDDDDDDDNNNNNNDDADADLRSADDDFDDQPPRRQQQGSDDDNVDNFDEDDDNHSSEPIVQIAPQFPNKLTSSSKLTPAKPLSPSKAPVQPQPKKAVAPKKTK